MKGRPAAPADPSRGLTGEGQPRHFSSLQRRTGTSHLPASAGASVCAQRPLPLIGEARVRRPGGPADWSQLADLSVRETGILSSSVMLTGGVGWGRRSPSVGSNPHVGQSCDEHGLDLGQGDPGAR